VIGSHLVHQLNLISILLHRTFVRAYKKSLEIHEALAQNRSRFAARLYEMSDELVNLAKEGERLRKLVSPPEISGLNEK
jgi:hypothetical protein